ncbi:hypothetical protein MMC22_002418 [Lobaria immixta]|nr:hypothetical protein [Lobaria immixta]
MSAKIVPLAQYYGQVVKDQTTRLAAINNGAIRITKPTTTSAALVRSPARSKLSPANLQVFAKIFCNKFRPMNLDKPLHLKGRKDMYRDQIRIEDGTLKLRKVTGSFKDYGAD